MWRYAKLGTAKLAYLHVLLIVLSYTTPNCPNSYIPGNQISSLRETVGTRGQLSSDVSVSYSVLAAGHVCDCVCVSNVCVGHYM